MCCAAHSITRPPCSRSNRLGIRLRRLPRRRDPRPSTPDPRIATPNQPPEIQRDRQDDPCASEQRYRSATPRTDILDCPTRNRDPMAPPTRRTPLDPTVRQESRSSTDRPRDPPAGHSARQRERRLGIPTHSRRTRPTRPQTRSINRLENPPNRRDRPDTRPDRPILGRIHPLAVEGHSGN